MHKKSMLMLVAVDSEEPEAWSYRNNRAGRSMLLRRLAAVVRGAGATRVLFVYEASSVGFGMYDEVTGCGFECVVVPPSHLERSWKHRANKTDKRDAELLLKMGRRHALLGEELAAVWVPDAEGRDDKELERARIETGEEVTKVKEKIQSLLTRQSLERPAVLGAGWTPRFLGWLETLASGTGAGAGVASALRMLLARLRTAEEWVSVLDEEIARRSRSERYAEAVKELRKTKGVGPLVAMAFLIEMGDLRRFRNRRQVGSYVGLAPKSYESGEATDRKGRITRQGPARVRKMLCQAVQSWVRWDPAAEAEYLRLGGGAKKTKRRAKVAMMRRLAVRLWRKGREVAERQAAGAAVRS